MCCQSEVELVHKKLGTMEGVVDVKVNLMLRRVAVTHDAERASVARLLRALNWSLLGASLVDEQGAVLSFGRGDDGQLGRNADREAQRVPRPVKTDDGADPLPQPHAA